MKEFAIELVKGVVFFVCVGVIVLTIMLIGG